MVFLFILLIFLILVLVIITSKFDVKIVNLSIDTQKSKYINDEYEFIIKLKIFGYIPILKLTLTKNRLRKIQERFKMNEKIKKIEKDIWKNKEKMDIKLKDVAKELHKSIYIEKLDLEILLGTENGFFTSIVVAILASILSIGISRIDVNENQVNYEIEPIYTDQNFIKIVISGIFQVKVIHIINIIYVFNKKGGRKNERTSNRRSYDYSYE